MYMFIQLRVCLFAVVSVVETYVAVFVEKKGDRRNIKSIFTNIRCSRDLFIFQPRRDYCEQVDTIEQISEDLMKMLKNMVLHSLKIRVDHVAAMMRSNVWTLQWISSMKFIGALSNRLYGCVCWILSRSSYVYVSRFTWIGFFSFLFHWWLCGCDAD